MVTISIILPVYNSETTLQQCIDSILDQTYSDFELIIIDDGSSDNTGQICDEYKNLDNRIIVIHQINLGISAARNTGLDMCNGQYIMFCDADDFVNCSWVEKMHNCIYKFPNSLITCAHTCVDTRGVDISDYQKTNNGILQNKHISYYELFKTGESGFVWNKIFSREIITNNDLHFEGEYAEDVYFTCNYLKHVGSVYFLPDILYYYRSVPQSITHKYQKDLLRFRLQAWYYRLPFIGIENITDYCDSNLASFYSLLANAYDNRNTDTFFQKYRYNKNQINSHEFTFLVDHSSGNKENHMFMWILRKHSYFVIFLFQKIVSFKRRLFDG